MAKTLHKAIKSVTRKFREIRFQEQKVPGQNSRNGKFQFQCAHLFSLFQSKDDVIVTTTYKALQYSLFQRMVRHVNKVTRINIPTLTSPRLNIGVSLPCSSRPLHLHILLLHILLLLHGHLHILLLNIHTFL